MTEIRAPMRGKVLKVLVGVGDRLSEDDEVVLLDSMKIEISVYSPGNGTVREVLVSEGDSLEDQALMMVLD